MKGIHGTRKVSANMIAEEKRINASQTGLRGIGAYYWDYLPGRSASADHARELAILSWRRKYGATSAVNDANSCAVVYFDFTNEVDECLDFSHGSDYYLDMLEYLREARGKIEAATNKAEREQALNAVYEDLAVTTEEIRGEPIRLIRHSIKLSQKHFPIVYLTGDPTCLISRYDDVGEFERVEYIPQAPFRLNAQS